MIAASSSVPSRFTRVMTDSGGCYKSRAFRAACQALGLEHIRTGPCTPKTNGKAERFIRIALRDAPVPREGTVFTGRELVDTCSRQFRVA